jgi:hypothetical protein
MDITIGGCITKENIVVKQMAIIMDIWKAMIMIRIKPKNLTTNYSKENLEKLSINHRTKSGRCPVRN